ncbi:hypothetical protein ACQ5SO_06790 [Rhodovulum sp. DZ06]|uniref:hypothetical protein n=1 Tax=Rhodovulum sp. DZ06 TaxID=3425126 RepID=UPI003D328397
MPISKLESLDIDHAYAPDAEPTMLERFDAWASAALSDPRLWGGVMLLIVVLFLWTAISSYTRAQRAKAKAAKHLKEEEEAELLARELAKLRNERQLKAG